IRRSRDGPAPSRIPVPGPGRRPPPTRRSAPGWKPASTPVRVARPRSRGGPGGARRNSRPGRPAPAAAGDPAPDRTARSGLSVPPGGQAHRWSGVPSRTRVAVSPRFDVPLISGTFTDGNRPPAPPEEPTMRTPLPRRPAAVLRIGAAVTVAAAAILVPAAPAFAAGQSPARGAPLSDIVPAAIVALVAVLAL